MITLCMDTSHVYLALALIKDDQVIASVQESCWKKQSEEIFPRLQEMMDKTSLKTEDIDQIAITEGPGSYTGVRIAMTIAKVFCAMRSLPLYTLGTLALYAGMRPNCRVLLDARGGRAYTAVYDCGKMVEAPSAEELEAIRARLSDDQEIVGDGRLVGREDVIPDLPANFLLLKQEWHLAENVHLVKPEYLKPAESYLTGKK